jgi:3',5'-nucleoside bisphosphate phosphatase
MSPPTFDLQCHSIHSDGALEPAEVIARAAAAGVRLAALTDHDTVDGVDEALAAGRREGIEVLRATEISAVAGSYGDLHILGYELDHRRPQLLEALRAFRADREQRAARMASALRELGFELDETLIRAREAEGKPVGRPHLAAACVACPENAERLSEEGIEDASALLERYLIEGRPAFRLREIPTVPEAVGLIHDSGGLAVWAHPFWDIKDPGEVHATIDRFAALGMDGVEAFYVTHSAEQTELAARCAAAHGMLTTGSSDFHGPDHRLFARFRAFSLHGCEPNLGPLAEQNRARSGA